MRSLYYTGTGGYDVLQVREEPDPVPESGSVVIRVSRAGLNFADIQARMGLYPDAPKPPMVMGYEVAGTVLAVGPQVTGLSVGQRVMAMTRFKGQATHVSVPTAFVTPLSDDINFDNAAALLVNYLTAFHMLHRVGGLRPKFRVLIHMAAGGVGLAAIQLCRLVEGVEMFGTASASKHDFLRESGLQHPIDYRTQDYVEEIRALTGGRGVDLILDPLGGADWHKGYKLLAPAGHLIAFGFSNLVTGPKRNVFSVLRKLLSVRKYSPMQLMDHNHSVSGVNIGHLWGAREMLREEMTALLELLHQGKISPRVDRVFPLDKAADAHRYVQERKNVGKVLFDCA